MVRCAILGAKGYAGCELIKILSKHPEVSITFLGSRDEGLTPISSLLPNNNKSNLCIECIDINKIIDVSDVIFLALPHTKSMEYVEKFIDAGKIVIDLSADYRFKNIDTYQKWYNIKHSSIDLFEKAVYGLPEINKKQISNANLIANPGCYPTAVILGLLPLIKEGIIETSNIVSDAKSGASGAGKKLNSLTQFCELNNNFYAYKVAEHQHMPEMLEILQPFSEKTISLTFVPYLLPIERGILATQYCIKKQDVSEADLLDLYNNFYKGQPFIRLLRDGVPQIKNIVNSNFCEIGFKVSKSSEHVVVISAIDNLLKGASGQAVHNMNIRMGFNESMGLL